MKKIILLVVVLLLAAVPIVMLTMKDQIAGWFTPDAENAEEEEEATPFFTLEELTIKLTENFKESKMESDDSYLVLRGDGYSVEIERVDHSSITPNEGYPFPSLTEAMEFYLLSLGELDFAKEGEILIQGDHRVHPCSAHIHIRRKEDHSMAAEEADRRDHTRPRAGGSDAEEGNPYHGRTDDSHGNCDYIIGIYGKVSGNHSHPLFDAGFWTHRIFGRLH